MTQIARSAAPDLDTPHWKSSDRKQRGVATALLDLEPRLQRLKNYRALPLPRHPLKAQLERMKKLV